MVVQAHKDEFKPIPYFYALPEALIPFMQSMPPGTSGLAAWNESAQQSAGDIVQLWFRFLGTRIERDAQLAKKLTTCRSPLDMALACSDFWQQAAMDYYAEFTEIGQAGRDALRNALEAARSASERQESSRKGDVK